MRLLGIEVENYGNFTKQFIPVCSGIHLIVGNALFNNQLVLVEGPSDATMLPILLEKGDFPSELLEWIGFPVLEGANPIKDSDDLAKQILRQERLINALGRQKIDRVYLLDGDNHLSRDWADLKELTTVITSALKKN